MGVLSGPSSGHHTTTMTRMLGWCLAAALLQAATPAKFFRTKFSNCGSILSIEDATAGSVTMTAPFNRRTGRHVLGKGRNVEICINGTLPSSGLRLQFDGCVGASPSCADMQPGQDIQLCSNLVVPTESPDVDVEVTWKVLIDNAYKDECETEFDVGNLRSQGKQPLVCIQIPARVQVPRSG